MRKITAFILLIFLFFSNTGMAVNIHYCQGSIENITIGFSNKLSCERERSSENKTGRCCAKMKTKDCCGNKTIKQEKKDFGVIKIQTQHLDQIAFIPLKAKVSHYKNLNKTRKTNQVWFYEVNSNAPPLYQLFQQYIYYA